MANDPPRRRGSLFGALVLIGLGLIFLYANLRPEWNPWPLISRYWPVLLIIYGLGRLWDALSAPPAPGAPQTRRRGGETAAVIVLLLLLGLVFFNGNVYSGVRHETKSIDAQGAQSVRMNIEMPAGELNISGGAAGKLLDADFHYTRVEGEPQISYDHSGSEGDLSITQSGNSHFGRTQNDWTLHLNDDLTRELRVQMGAGRGNLNLSGVHLTKLTVEIGAGEINADLTGDWKQNVDVRIEGGVGRASIRLPRSVGVRVQADGALGSINVRGLHSQGDYYVNDAYGSSPVTMNVRAEGGIGEIQLIEQP